MRKLFVDDYLLVRFFYRATLSLCVSVVFAVARCLTVRPFVCPCVTLVHCMAEDIVKLLSRPVAPSFYFFTPSAGTQFQGKPFHRGHKIHGVRKFCDVRLKSSSISETIRERPMVAIMGAGTGGAGWASAHPGKNQGGHGPPWKF